MVRVRYTGDSLYSRRDGPTWTPEDDVHDVDDGLAEALVRRERFEYADGDEPDPEEPDTIESEDTESKTESKDGDDGTCAAMTADDTPCENPAGPDGYCHIDGHGPEG